MSRVAEDLRRETLAAAASRTAEERLALALAIGDSDLALYRAGTRASEESARQAFERQRARGRRPSACAAGR